MADKSYTVTVASGNLYGGGTGNVFYLDGLRNSTGPGTIDWVPDATLRFEQTDNASNNNHPLIFSTTTLLLDQLFNFWCNILFRWCCYLFAIHKYNYIQRSHNSLCRNHSILFYRFLLFMLCAWYWHGWYYGYGC